MRRNRRNYSTEGFNRLLAASNLLMRSPVQLALIDSCGNPPFNFADVLIVDDKTNMINIAGMMIQLEPKPTNLEGATKITVEALCALHRVRSQWHYSKPGCIEPISLDIWRCKSCSVSFRRNIDAGIILASYSSDHLDLSLPSPRMWKSCGLNWLPSYHPCCERNRNNPTPWMGRSCRCAPNIKRTHTPHKRAPA